MENKKQLRLVWEKAKSLQNYDSNCIRKDKCGAWIKFALIPQHFDLTLFISS